MAKLYKFMRLFRNMKKRVSVIMPAFNEAKRIKNVISVVLKSPYVSELIVIDDGSKDGTFEVASKIKHKKLRVFALRKNSGKASAMKYGLKKSKEDYILFLDSDLVGLNVGNLEKIILPVLEGKVDVTFCMHGNSPWKFYKIDYLSGMRCIKKSLLGDFSFLNNIPGFGAETSMNKLIIKKNLSIGVVPWKNVISPAKKEDVRFAFIKYFKIAEAARKTGGGYVKLISMIRNLKKRSIYLG